MKLPFSASRRAARMLVTPLLVGVTMIQAGAGAKAAGEVGSESYGGTLTLGAANSYTGSSVTINTGSSAIINAGALFTGASYYPIGANLVSSYVSYQNGGAGVLTLNGESGTTLVGGSTVALTNESIDITPPSDFSSYAGYSGFSGSYVTSTALAGTAGTLVLNGNFPDPTPSTYPSVAGTITLTNGGKLTATGSGTLSLGDGSTMAFDANSALILAAGSTVTFSYNTTPGLASSGVTVALANGSVFINGGGTLTQTNGTIAFGDGVTTTVRMGLPTVPPVAPPIPAISGSVSGLTFKTNPDTGKLHVKATVALTNHLDEVLHQVTATVYLSDDATLSSDDIKLVTLNLADYAPKGRLGEYRTLSMPLHHKIPAALAAYLEGKYLIVDLDAVNLDASAIKQPVVIGPITLP